MRKLQPRPSPSAWMPNAAATEKNSAPKYAMKPPPPRKPAPTPARLMSAASSAFASSISRLTRTERSRLTVATSSPRLWSSTGRPPGRTVCVMTTPSPGSVQGNRANLAPGSVLVVAAAALLHALVDRRHDRGVGECGDVTQLAMFGDISKQPPHDLAGPGLR